jgi:hypothetical protein
VRSCTEARIEWLFPCFLIVGLAAPATEAESIGKGRYRGVYHVDRWDRTTFDILTVDPALRARLAPLQGVPLEIEATGVDQPENPGPATVTAIGKVEALASAIGLSLRWNDSPASKTATYLQIPEGMDPHQPRLEAGPALGPARDECRFGGLAPPRRAARHRESGVRTRGCLAGLPDMRGYGDRCARRVE